jgi:hypothetical protein
MRRAATPITRVELEERKARTFFEWDYAGPGDDGHPFEWKPSDWGYLDGRVVAIDCNWRNPGADRLVIGEEWVADSSRNPD